MAQARLELLADSRQVRGAKRDLDALNRSGGAAERTTRLLGRAFVALSAAISVREVTRLSDAYTQIQNKLKVVTDSSEQLADVQQRLLDISNETRSDLDATVTLYSRTARATEELGISQDRLLGIIETVNKSFALSGATAQEASNAIRQLSQGLASGALRGEEFNSVAEQAPEILRAVSAETGKSVGQLREFAATGGITSELLIRSLENYGSTVDEIFSKSSATIEQSFTIARNNAVDFIGGLESVQDASRAFGDLVVDISENLDGLGNAALAAGGVFAVSLTPAVGRYVIAQAAAAKVTLFAGATAITTANKFGILTTTAASTTVAANALRLTMSTLLGPVGLVITAVGAAAFAFSNTDTSMKNAEESARSLKDEISKLAGEYTKLSDNVLTTKVRQAQAAVNEINAENLELLKQEAQLIQRRNELLNTNIAAAAREQRALEEVQGKIAENNEEQQKAQVVLDAALKIRKRSRDELLAEAEATKKSSRTVSDNAESITKVVGALNSQILELQLGSEEYEKMQAVQAAGVGLNSAEAESIRGLVGTLQQLRAEREAEAEAKRTTQEFGQLQGELGIETAENPQVAQLEAQLQQRLELIQEYRELENANKQEADQAELDARKAYQDELTRIDEEAAEKRAAFAQQSTRSTLTAFGDFFGNLAEIARNGGEESFEAYKVLASAQAGISAALAVLQVYSDATIPTFLKFPLSATIAGLAAAQIAQIQSASYSGARALGGQVVGGGSYLVGERGPELFTPNSSGSGRITPFNQLMSESREGAGNQIINNDTFELNVTMPPDESLQNWAINNRDLFYNIIRDAKAQRGEAF